MKIHKVQCDRCGREEKLKEPSFNGLGMYFYLPDSWKNTEAGDLCGKCLGAYERALKEFKNS